MLSQYKDIVVLFRTKNKKGILINAKTRLHVHLYICLQVCFSCESMWYSLSIDYSNYKNIQLNVLLDLFFKVLSLLL